MLKKMALRKSDTGTEQEPATTEAEGKSGHVGGTRTQKNDVAYLLAQLPVSEENLAKMLSTCTKNIGRWKRGENQPRPDNIQRIWELKQIAELGSLVYNRDGLRMFLFEPQSQFKGKNAFQLIMAGDLDEVMEALSADYEGLGF